jgi:SAM-dependent methyltransferase
MADRYETPWQVDDLEDCEFYHTIDLPQFGTQEAQWDLRPTVDAYLSNIEYRGKTVLEVGTADGYLTFELEKRGADVVSYDLAEGMPYDAKPYHAVDVNVAQNLIAESVGRYKRAYWLGHRLFDSNAHAVYGHVNDIHDNVSRVDIAFFGDVLLHLENPLRALASAARVASTIVVTEVLWLTEVDRDAPALHFHPMPRPGDDPVWWCFTWYQVTPGLLRSWFEILGFRVREEYDHVQRFNVVGRDIPHFTIIAERM